MRHLYAMSEEYADLAAEVIEEHQDLHWLLDADIDIGYLKSNQAKKAKGREVHGECILVKDLYQPFCPYDFLIVLYDQNIAGFTDEQIRILLYHELLHIDVSEKDGEPVYSVAPHDVEDFRAVIEQYGIDWSGR